MLDDGKLITFIATASPERSRRFYRDTLGLKLVSEDNFALVFEAGSTRLRIQKLAKPSPPPHTALGWHVGSIEETVVGLDSAGVCFEQYDGLDQDEMGIWTAPSGTKVAWFRDPDGNILSLTAES